MAGSRNAVRKLAKKRKLDRASTSHGERLPYPDAVPLTEDQEARKLFLETEKIIEPSRWICEETIDELGIRDSVELLTSRLGLWDFLRQECNTYRSLTIEFLSSLVFDRSSRVMTFNLGGYYHEISSSDLMHLLNFPTDDIEHMRQITDFFHDMTISHFRSKTCDIGVIGDQRTKTINHPTLRYIQRVLGHTLWARGETASVVNHKELFYLCCMLRRNNGEMNYMPHLGYNLCKHLDNQAKSHTSNGRIRIGGIITKIALARNIPLPDQADIVPGKIKVDLETLVRSQLIVRDPHDEFWMNVGAGTIRHRLPLETDINPLNEATWKIVDIPVVPQVVAPPPPVVPQAAADAPPQFQQVLDSMQAMQNAVFQRMNDMQLHFDQRMDNIVTDVNRRMDLIETDAHRAEYYAKKVYHHTFPEEEDEPPTPPHVRRAGIRREREERARKAAEEAARAAEGPQEAQVEEEEGEQSGEDGEEENVDHPEDMDADD